MSGLNFKIYNQRVKFWLCSWNATAINRRMPKYAHINGSRVVLIWSKNASLTSTIISSDTAARSISIQQLYIHFPQDFTCACLLSLLIKFIMFCLCNLHKNTKNSGSCGQLIYIACMGLDEIKQGRLRYKSSQNWGISSRFKTAFIFQLLFLLN